MKKTVFVILAMVLLLAVCLAAPMPASASIDDFDVDYTITPEVVGYKGADIGIRLRVHNEGLTPITAIRVEVTTMDGYRYDRVRTIAVGTTTPWLLFEVPFGRDDVNADKLLTVKIENDADSNWDGTWVRTIRVEGTHDIFDGTVSISPDSEYYLLGQTITLTYSFHNKFEANAATDVDAHALFHSANPIRETRQTEHFAMIMPESSAEVVMTHTFTEQDVGMCEVGYSVAYTMMGQRYAEADYLVLLEVRAPEPDIDFDCVLSADKTEIEAGEEVEFLAEFTNTGDDNTSFEIRDAEGSLVATLGTYPTGGEGYARLNAHIFETTDVSYVVIASLGGESESKETNSVRITVIEPEETPMPAVTETEETAAPTVTPSPLPSSTVQSAESSGEAEQNAAQQEPEPIENLALYIIIGALGLLVVAAAITVPILLHRNKKKGGGKRKDTL
ncbi:MAG: hypothetical protein HN948_08055 [Clostridia bacterium]|jgi:hypothetical protein|nr:hypothetical protein [Clostridia bacterium]MBT7122947.1 hypothetical protein [Clostridia bacterium]